MKKSLAVVTNVALFFYCSLAMGEFVYALQTGCCTLHKSDVDMIHFWLVAGC
jgi:hypothetical protein